MCGEIAQIIFLKTRELVKDNENALDVVRGIFQCTQRNGRVRNG